ncbi:hypothetical protein [Streptomyces sp. NPDC001781]
MTAGAALVVAAAGAHGGTRAGVDAAARPARETSDPLEAVHVRETAGQAARVGARTVAMGRSPRGPPARFADGGMTSALAHGAPGDVVPVDAEPVPRQLTEGTPAKPRDGAVRAAQDDGDGPWRCGGPPVLSGAEAR